MKLEEAIGRIKEHKIKHFGQEPRAIYITKALDIAIKSLEKQISKKVIYEDDEQDFIRCPNCNYELADMDDYYYEKYNYCPNCGQKIKWE